MNVELSQYGIEVVQAFALKFVQPSGSTTVALCVSVDPSVSVLSAFAWNAVLSALPSPLTKALTVNSNESKFLVSVKLLSRSI